VELTFDRVLGILGIILTIIFIVLDKAGKLRGPALLGLLGLAALMTLPIALGNSWVKSSPWGMLGFSKSMFMVSLVAICYSALAIWISPSTVKERTDKDAQSNPDAKLGPPHSEIERPIGSAEPPATTPKESVSTGAFSTPTADEIYRERRVIVTGLIEKFKRSHKGRSPTYEWVNERLRDQGKNFQLVQPNVAAVITDSTIDVNGGTAILNETGKALIIDNTYIGGRDGIVMRSPEKELPEKAHEKIEHRKSEPQYDPAFLSRLSKQQLIEVTKQLTDEMIDFDNSRTKAFLNLVTEWDDKKLKNPEQKDKIDLEMSIAMTNAHSDIRSEFRKRYLDKACAVRDEMLLRIRKTPEQAEQEVMANLSPTERAMMPSFPLSRALMGEFVGDHPIPDAAAYLNGLGRLLQ
jgi:hypothetical protein